MIFAVYGAGPGTLGREYRQFDIEGTNYIGMGYGEPYEIRFFNSFMHPIRVELIDGGGSLINVGTETQKFVISHQKWLRVSQRIYDDKGTDLVFGEIGWPDKCISATVEIETARPELWVDSMTNTQVIEPKFHKRFTITCVQGSVLRRMLERHSGGSQVVFDQQPVESGRRVRNYTTKDGVNQVEVPDPWRFKS